MEKLFEVRQSPELMRELDQILRHFRSARHLSTSTPETLLLAVAAETQLRKETIEQIWQALVRAQSPVLDLEVLEAMDHLKLAVCGRRPALPA